VAFIEYLAKDVLGHLHELCELSDISTGRRLSFRVQVGRVRFGIGADDWLVSQKTVCVDFVRNLVRVASRSSK
jgi:hypothetical protein